VLIGISCEEKTYSLFMQQCNIHAIMVAIGPHSHNI